MKQKQNYEIYCLYHNKVSPEYYGDQIDQITFVKMDKGPYVFESKKHIHLIKESWFKSIGKEWAEYEFYYSLYKGYLEGRVELPEYMGFTQYDMEFRGKEDKYKNISMIDFIDECFENGSMNKDSIIGFQPYDFEVIYNQEFIIDSSRPNILIDPFYENCIDTIIGDCNDFTNQNRSINEFKNKEISMCGSVFLHKDVFIKLMVFLSQIIDSKKLNKLNKKNRSQGGILERYFSIYLEYIVSKKIYFDVLHNFYVSKTIFEKKISIKDILKYFISKINNFLIFKLKFKKMNNFCVLLTATINPNGCNFLKRLDPEIREKDYLEALELWLKKTNFKIVFCENSGYDLKNIKDLCDRYPKRVEIIQFNGNNYPRNLGKGYGEFKIIEKALERSIFIENSNYIIKCIGRVFVKNINNLAFNYPSKTSIGFMYSNNVKLISSAMLIFDKKFFELSKKYSNLIDDSKGVYFEHIIQKTIKDLKSLKLTYYMFEKVFYQGFSGSLNEKYNVIYDIEDTEEFFMDKVLGLFGKKIKSIFPRLFKILKPYFPDKK